MIRKLYKPFISENMSRPLDGRSYKQTNNFVHGKKEKEKITTKKNAILNLKPLEIGKSCNFVASITGHFFLAVHATTCTGQEAY